MTAGDARRLVRALGADDAAAKVVADAPALSDDQIVVLRGILLSEHVDGADPAADPICDQGLARRGLRGS
jgi:hypothetical protein